MISKQKAEMEKRQQKIERAKNRLSQSQEKKNAQRDISDEDTASEGEMDQLDKEHAKMQIQPSLPVHCCWILPSAIMSPVQVPVPDVVAEKRRQLPMKTTAGQIVFDQQTDAAAVDLVQNFDLVKLIEH